MDSKRNSMIRPGNVRRCRNGGLAFPLVSPLRPQNSGNLTQGRDPVCERGGRGSRAFPGQAHRLRSRGEGLAGGGRVPESRGRHGWRVLRHQNLTQQQRLKRAARDRQHTAVSGVTLFYFLSFPFLSPARISFRACVSFSSFSKSRAKSWVLILVKGFFKKNIYSVPISWTNKMLEKFQ
jgi:hypothetical protein